MVARWTGESVVHVSWEDYFKRVVPTAVAASVDISVSNASFLFVTVSLYTMCKSTSIIFLLVFAIVLGVERPSMVVAGTTALIALGVFLFTYADTQVSANL